MADRLNLNQSLRFVLDGLRFPAQGWEIITQADSYGADATTSERLRRLPLRGRTYLSVDDVINALDAVPAPRTVHRSH
jgi:hypothetical protein